MLKLWEPFEGMMTPFAKWPAFREMAWPEWPKWEAELPVVNVEEKEGAIVMGAELPGFAPEEVNVTVKNHVLEIVGKHEEEGGEEGRTFRRFNEFRRRFTLPNNVDGETIKAEMANGLLTVTLPKAALPEAEVKTIEVTTAPKVIEGKEA
jgi:HSP20 family molecular chaperone IbpA